MYVLDVGDTIHVEVPVTYMGGTSITGITCELDIYPHGSSSPMSVYTSDDVFDFSNGDSKNFRFEYSTKANPNTTIRDVKVFIKSGLTTLASHRFESVYDVSGAATTTDMVSMMVMVMMMGMMMQVIGGAKPEYVQTEYPQPEYTYQPPTYPLLERGQQ